MKCIESLAGASALACAHKPFDNDTQTPRWKDIELENDSIALIERTKGTQCRPTQQVWFDVDQIQKSYPKFTSSLTCALCAAFILVFFCFFWAQLKLTNRVWYTHTHTLWTYRTGQHCGTRQNKLLDAFGPNVCYPTIYYFLNLFSVCVHARRQGISRVYILWMNLFKIKIMHFRRFTILRHMANERTRARTHARAV